MASQKGYNRGMNLPKRGHVGRTALLRVFKIFEGQPQNTDRNRSDQVTSVTSVELKSQLLQMRLNDLSVGAIFLVNRRFYNYSGCGFAGCLRNLHVDVAIPRIDAGIDEIRACDLH